MHKAASLGFTVAKPYGDSARFDFIVESNGHITRVQVKSVAVTHYDTYRIGSSSGHSSKHAYTRREIDLLAAYVVPLDVWYLIPVSAFTPIKTIRLCPHLLSRRRFEQFREAWHLLRGPKCVTEANK